MGSIHEIIHIGHWLIGMRKGSLRLNFILLIRLTLIDTGIAIFLFIAEANLSSWIAMVDPGSHPVGLGRDLTFL